MRIISKGIAPTEREYQHTCRHCNTIFGFYLKEVKKHYDPRDGTWYTCNCPHTSCGGSISFTSLVPLQL